jgi:hypothetical protein
MMKQSDNQWQGYEENRNIIKTLVRRVAPNTSPHTLLVLICPIELILNNTTKYMHLTIYVTRNGHRTINNSSILPVFN